MLKIRITFASETELAAAIKKIEANFKILNQSKIYKGRGSSAYSNIYLDVENK